MFPIGSVVRVVNPTFQEKYVINAIGKVIGHDEPYHQLCFFTYHKNKDYVDEHNQHMATLFTKEELKLVEEKEAWLWCI